MIYLGMRAWGTPRRQGWQRRPASLLAAAALLVPLASIPSAKATVSPYFPTRLTHLGNARQVLVVTGDSLSSSYATLRAYQLGNDGIWRLVMSPMSARTGYAGWVWGSQRVQNSGTSPIGTFTLTTAFGLATNPGVHLPYFHAGPGAYMAGDPQDPKTYDVLQTTASNTRTWRVGTATAERVGDYPVQYQYGAVIDYNRPGAQTVTWSVRLREYVTSRPVNTHLGFAIYLHIAGRGATAGCVSIARVQELQVLRWLDPAMRPRIVMAPLSKINSA